MEFRTCLVKFTNIDLTNSVIKQTLIDNTRGIRAYNTYHINGRKRRRRRVIVIVRERERENEERELRKIVKRVSERSYQ